MSSTIRHAARISVGVRDGISEMRRTIGIVMMIIGFTAAAVNPFVAHIGIPVGIVGIIVFVWGLLRRSRGRTYE